MKNTTTLGVLGSLNKVKECAQFTGLSGKNAVSKLRIFWQKQCQTCYSKGEVIRRNIYS